MLPHAARVWGGLALGATLLDYVCDRGEPNGDTITEQVCLLLDKIPGGRKVILPAACVIIPAWFYNHIDSKFDIRIELLKSI